jgi:hypothetical protein
MSANVRALAELSLRAAHHEPEALPWVAWTAVAFDEEGFEVPAKSSTMWFKRNGRIYRLDRARVNGRLIAGIYQRGDRSHPIVQVDVTGLNETLTHSRGRTAEYDTIPEPIRDAARQVRAHADTP